MFRPKRIQLGNKSFPRPGFQRSVDSLQTQGPARLLVTLDDGPCASRILLPPEAARGPAGLFSLCSGGDTVPGVKSWQWGAQEPTTPAGTIIQSSVWVSFVQWVRLPTMGSGDLECQGPKLN